MKAYYDLSARPATFDFITFMVTAMSLGATEIVFDVSKGFQKKKFSEDIARQMYEMVLQPACELWGIRFSEGTEGDFSPGHHVTDLVEAWEKTKSLPIPAFEPRAGHVYTITLRDSIRNRHRNSNRAAWERFASEVNAHIIDDAYIAPISMFERFRIYNGAMMNYFTNNGPSVLCMFTRLHYVSFNTKASFSSWPHPIRPGFQFPWANQHQRIVWNDDTYENIRAAHESMR